MYPVKSVSTLQSTVKFKCLLLPSMNLHPNLKLVTYNNMKTAYKKKTNNEAKDKQDHIATESSKVCAINKHKKLNKNRGNIIFMSVQYQRLTNNN